MDNLEFSEEEIQQQLELLGYTNISKEKLQEFKKGIDNLIRSGEWTTLVSPENSQIDVTETSPPAFTQEKVSRPAEGFFLHPQNKDDVQVLSPQNRDLAPPFGRLDSYVRHSVAPKPPVHVGRSNRLQTETEPDDTLQTDSYVSAPGSGPGRRLVKRKVLRKHRGQSLVCDESVYSEDSEGAVTQAQLINPLMSEPSASRRSLFRSGHKMYKIQQEDAEDSTHSSFWSDKETEDEEDEFQPGFKTEMKSTKGTKEDVKCSDSEEVECFVDDLKSKNNSHNEETLDEESLKQQDQNASTSSENYESDDSWEECGSDEKENEEEIQDEENVLEQEVSKPSGIQKRIEIGVENSDILNTRDEDETVSLRKTGGSETSSGTSNKGARKKWKDFSDDSSINTDTSSEDEAEARDRRKSSSLDSEKCGQSHGKTCGKYSGNSSGNPESTSKNSEFTTNDTDSGDVDVCGENLDGEKARKPSSDDLKTYKIVDYFKTQNQKEEMAKTTGESELSGYIKSIKSDDIESGCGFAISKGEDGKSTGSSQNGEDYNGRKSKEDMEIQAADSKFTEISTNVSQTSPENDRNDLKSSQDIESEIDASCTAKNMDSTSEFTEGILAKSSSNEDVKDTKRLRKDPFFDHSESGDISSDSSNRQNWRCEKKSRAKEKTKYKVFSEDSSENGETDTSDENWPKTKVESEKGGQFSSDNDKTSAEISKGRLENSGNKVDLQGDDHTMGTESCKEQLGEKTRNLTGSSDEMSRFHGKISNAKTKKCQISTNSEMANVSHVEGDDNHNDEFEPNISRQNSQSTSTDHSAKDEKKPNKSQAILDLNKKPKKDVEECHQIVNIGENIGKVGSFNAQRCSATVDLENTCLKAENGGYKNSKSSNVEHDGKIQEVSENSSRETFVKSSNAFQENLEADNTIIGVSKDGQFGYNIKKQLEGSQGDDEEVESWFEEDSSKHEKEIMHRNDLKEQDLDEIIHDNNQTTSESPATSLLTSGYGTIRSEKPNIEDDTLTINEFDKDSLYSFGVCEQESGEIHGLTRSYHGNEGQSLVQDDFWDGRVSENIVEGNEEGRLEAQLCLGKGESSEEEEGNEDIKFIDSKVDSSHQKMYQDWEGNLRHSTGASFLEERLANLHLSTSVQHESENEELTSHSESPSADSLSEGAFESYVRGMSRSYSDRDIGLKPKSFIRPALGPTGLKKTDPVAKYFQYKQLWDVFKMPGENYRKALRWEVRKRLAYQPPPPKPRKALVVNRYTVPTEKKRSALRWEIRNDLAGGNLPLSCNYRF